MALSSITYVDIVVKQQVKTWAEGVNFDPEEKIFMLFEDKFGIGDVSVMDAHPEGDNLILTIRMDAWEKPREFALLKDGSLAW